MTAPPLFTERPCFETLRPPGVFMEQENTDHKHMWERRGHAFFKARTCRHGHAMFNEEAVIAIHSKATTVNNQATQI
jgi:hypothetical protein